MKYIDLLFCTLQSCYFTWQWRSAAGCRRGAAPWGGRVPSAEGHTCPSSCYWSRRAPPGSWSCRLLGWLQGGSPAYWPTRLGISSCDEIPAENLNLVLEQITWPKKKTTDGKGRNGIDWCEERVEKHRWEGRKIPTERMNSERKRKVHLCALMNRLCGSSVKWLCWRSRTSSWDLSSLSASRHTWFQPASSFLRLPLESSLRNTNNTASSVSLSLCLSVRTVNLSVWTLLPRWGHRAVFCASLCYNDPITHWGTIR